MLRLYFPWLDKITLTMIIFRELYNPVCINNENTKNYCLSMVQDLQNDILYFVEAVGGNVEEQMHCYGNIDDLSPWKKTFYGSRFCLMLHETKKHLLMFHLSRTFKLFSIRGRMIPTLMVQKPFIE